MKTITIPGFIQAKTNLSRWDLGPNVIDGLKYDFWCHEDMGQGFIKVCAHTLTFDLPEGWDPRPAQVSALEAKKADLQAQYAAAVALINQQIAALLCIEHTESAR